MSMDTMIGADLSDKKLEKDPKEEVPSGANIVPFQAIRDAIGRVRGSATIHKVALSIGADIRPGDILESLFHMTEEERDNLLASLGGQIKKTYESYSGIRRTANEMRADPGITKLSFNELARRLDRYPSTMRQFLHSLDYSSDMFDFPGKDEDLSEPAGDPGAKVKRMYAEAVRDLKMAEIPINSVTIAARLKSKSKKNRNVSKEWVDIFLANPENQGFIEKALQNEV